MNKMIITINLIRAKGAWLLRFDRISIFPAIG